MKLSPPSQSEFGIMIANDGTRKSMQVYDFLLIDPQQLGCCHRDMHWYEMHHARHMAYDYPKMLYPLDSGNGSIKSMPIESHGFVGIGNGWCFPNVSWFVVFECWHASHVAQNSRTSFPQQGHQCHL